MSNTYIGTHKTWGITCYGTSKEDAAQSVGAPVTDIDFVEMSTTEYLLRDVPQEFASVLSYMAYERGHSAGESECEMILGEMISNLLPAIKAFEKRILEKC